MASPPELIAYGDHPSQVCELYAADASEAVTSAQREAGVAVLVHGGFWRRRYGRELQHGIARDLHGRGWAVWNLEYRRLGDGGGWPHTFDDVAAAIDALADTGLDLDRVVAIGHSAGGQLAVWAATRDAPRVPLTAVVSQAGALDLDELSRLGTSNGVVNELLEGTPAEVPHRYDAVSPARRLPVGVPLLVVHGARDGDVPVHVSREFAAAAGCELVVIDDESHYEHLEPGSRSWGAVIDWLETGRDRP